MLLAMLQEGYGMIALSIDCIVCSLIVGASEDIAFVRTLIYMQLLAVSYCAMVSTLIFWNDYHSHMLQ